eukprot:1137473-Pelagomonas_calceolata.AAC.3
MSTNPYSKLLNAYPHLCCTLGTIPSNMLLPPSGSPKNSRSPTNPGAYKLLLSGILQQESV